MSQDLVILTATPAPKPISRLPTPDSRLLLLEKE
jgi:hypothetical protein